MICSMDIAFILDSSESAKTFLFEKQKAFVRSFSERVMPMQLVGWHLKIRLAALQFSSSVSIDHNFLDWQDVDVFQSRVSAMVYIGQGTYSFYALTNATQLFTQETSPENVRVAILMTDGVDHPRSPNAIGAAAEAKSHNIKVFAIGLSDLAREAQNSAKLRSIASSPSQNVNRSESFNQSFWVLLGPFCVTLPCRIRNVTRSLFSGCGVKCRESPLDLVFIIDSSESVGPGNFNSIKDFMNTMIDRVSVSREATRVGVVLYSHVTVLMMGLQQQANQDEVKAAVRRMPYLGEGTFTGSAIRRANQVFQAARPGAHKVGILITDGQADKRDPIRLESAVREAHASNIEMFVIGVVNDSGPLYVDFKNEVNTIASDPDEEHAFLIDDFTALPSTFF
uniref:VWFA domain-containing protein n=1 Tax=Scleropages formosus TaxID=113540 RepID=A0A8C9SIJ7_SCLFO